MIEALLVAFVWLSGYWIGHAMGEVRARAELVRRDMQRLVDQTARLEGKVQDAPQAQDPT